MMPVRDAVELEMELAERAGVSEAYLGVRSIRALAEAGAAA